MRRSHNWSEQRLGHDHTWQGLKARHEAKHVLHPLRLGRPLGLYSLHLEPMGLRLGRLLGLQPSQVGLQHSTRNV
jgi:hypothetical protein